jgi:hypothetical protein
VDKKVAKLKTVHSSNLAGALAWLGFPYTKVIKGIGHTVYIFERNRHFDKAYNDLCAMRNLYKGE